MKVGKSAVSGSSGLKNLAKRLFNKTNVGSGPSVETSFVDESKSNISSSAYLTNDQVDSLTKLTNLPAKNETNS